MPCDRSNDCADRVHMYQRCQSMQNPQGQPWSSLCSSTRGTHCATHTHTHTHTLFTPVKCSSGFLFEAAGCSGTLGHVVTPGPLLEIKCTELFRMWEFLRQEYYILKASTRGCPHTHTHTHTHSLQCREQPDGIHITFMYVFVLAFISHLSKYWINVWFAENIR